MAAKKARGAAKFFLEFSSAEDFESENHAVVPLLARSASGAIRESMDATQLLADRFATEHPDWYADRPEARIYCRVIDEKDQDLGARWILRASRP